MTGLEISFWILFFLVFYTYLGYGIFLFFLILIKRAFRGKPPQIPNDAYLPTVTLLVAAYNEEDYIEAKIINSLALNYPENKIRFLFVTDGSSDRTPEIIGNYAQIKLYHSQERKGKIAAVDRVMPFVETEIVIYSDANTNLNADAIKNIVRHYKNPQVGAVAGEKRILKKDKDQASGAGEGIYWRYESQLKKWDSEMYSVVGAAGELFSIRTELFEQVPKDSIIEDFYMTLRIAMNGHRVIYEPEAFAEESSSASVSEELKRKIRIAAGGIQSVIRLAPLLNVFRYGILSFQYVSHRVLRWTITPLAMIALFFINLILAINSIFYLSVFILQVLFYLFALIGFWLESRHIKIKILFIPFYFCMMNYAVLAGMIRYFKGNQSVVWEKAKRA